MDFTVFNYHFTEHSNIIFYKTFYLLFIGKSIIIVLVINNISLRSSARSIKIKVNINRQVWSNLFKNKYQEFEDKYEVRNFRKVTIA